MQPKRKHNKYTEQYTRGTVTSIGYRFLYYDVIHTCHIHWATVCETFRPMLSARCPVCAVLSVCNVGVLWPNGWMDPDETWHAVGLGPGHIVLDGKPALPPPKGAQPLLSFRPMSTVAKRLDRSRCHLVWR